MVEIYLPLIPRPSNPIALLRPAKREHFWLLVISGQFILVVLRLYNIQQINIRSGNGSILRRLPDSLNGAHFLRIQVIIHLRHSTPLKRLLYLLTILIFWTQGRTDGSFLFHDLVALSMQLGGQLLTYLAHLIWLLNDKRLALLISDFLLLRIQIDLHFRNYFQSS